VAQIVVGAANNQLLDDQADDKLIQDSGFDTTPLHFDIMIVTRFFSDTITIIL
jgi:hypothetical protein